MTDYPITGGAFTVEGTAGVWRVTSGADVNRNGYYAFPDLPNYYYEVTDYRTAASD